VTLRDVIEESKRERGAPVPVGVLAKAILHPTIALQAGVAVFSYRGARSRAVSLTESELRKAQSLFPQELDKAELAGMILRYQRAICYHTSYLYPLCRKVQPEIVVETGVYFGASSAFILQALADNGKGHLYSIDLRAAFAAPEGTARGGSRQPVRSKEAGFTVPETLRDRWTFIVGDSRRELAPLLERLGAIGLFHHDSEHTYGHMTFEFESAYGALREGGLLVSDDVLWNSAFADFAKRHAVEGHISGGVGFVLKPSKRPSA
jgi:hypothetical protein